MDTIETVDHYAAKLARQGLVDARALAAVLSSENARLDAAMMPGIRFLCDAAACAKPHLDALQAAADGIGSTGWYLADRPDLDGMSRDAVSHALAVWDAYRLEHPKETARARASVQSYLGILLQGMVASARYASREVRNIMLDALAAARKEGTVPPACTSDLPMVRRGIARLDAFSPVTFGAAKAAMSACAGMGAYGWCP